MAAGDVAERDRIGTGRKHDWDCCGRRPGGEDGRVAARSCEQRDLALKEFGRERRQAIVLTIRKAINNPNILALDITRFSQSGLKSCHHVGRPTARTALEEPDHRHHRLLRACRERPRCRRAAEQRDELAAPHVGHLGVLPRFVPRPWLYDWFVALQGITERTAGPWATPEM